MTETIALHQFICICM